MLPLFTKTPPYARHIIPGFLFLSWPWTRLEVCWYQWTGGWQFKCILNSNEWVESNMDKYNQWRVNLAYWTPDWHTQVWACPRAFLLFAWVGQITFTVFLYISKHKMTLGNHCDNLTKMTGVPGHVFHCKFSFCAETCKPLFAGSCKVTYAEIAARQGSNT